MDGFLIPANSKKSMLIFGLFTKFDIILFGIGIATTLLLLIIFELNTLVMAIIALSPALITGFLVLPVPYYHNIRTVIKSATSFLLGRRDFVWKGWGMDYGKEQE